jgi:hypothetical protein
MGDEEIVELTYLPTRQTRWYDVAKKRWASAASKISGWQVRRWVISWV